MLFICYARCSTCKKAQKWLDDRGVKYTWRDIKGENPSEEELSVWIEKSGQPLKRWFNTSGIPYRELGLKDKRKDMTEKEQIKLLATNGMLVKRPIVVAEDFVLVGFREEEWSEKF